MVTGERTRRDARVDGLRWALIAAVSGIHFGVVACAGKSSKDADGGSGDGGTSGTSAGQGGAAAGMPEAGKGGSGGVTTNGGDAGRNTGGGTGGSAGASRGGSAGAGAVSGAGSGGVSGGAAKGGSAGTGNPGGAGSGTGENPFPCTSADPWGSTLQSCGEGTYVHRPSAVACPLPDHDASVSEGGAPGEPGTLPCAQDSDCAAGEYCVLGMASFCIHPCTDDASCPDNSVCVCDKYLRALALGTESIEAGRCVYATCTSDADCEPGFACAAPLDTGDGCGQSPSNFACQTPDDECGGKEQCGPNEVCNGARPRTCEIAPACGRPFLVAGDARSARSVPSAEWLDAALSSAPFGCVAREGTGVEVDALDAAARGVIAKHWLEAGAMEHASVAAFARFALELMALGAPARLVEATTRAMADETRHARFCYGLAARYSGEARGPGALDVTDALAECGLLAVVERAVLEGCIGETQAAVEAAWAAEAAADPVVRDVLERIAEDETRHAALAFDFVAWASERDRTVRALVERTFARARAQAVDEARRDRAATGVDSAADALPAALRATLAAHGVLDESTRRAARRAALGDVLPSVWSAALGRSVGDAAPEALGHEVERALDLE